jgi:hypothetical protein
MVEVDPNDLAQLIKLLSQLGIMQSSKGREAVLIAASLQQIRSHIDLEGPTTVVVPVMLQTLSNYGRLSHGEDAIVQFLNAVKEYVGEDQKRIIDDIVQNRSAPRTRNMSIDGPKLSPSEVDAIPEKIIGENTLRDITYLRRAIRSCASVAKLAVNKKNERWVGTAFFISDLLS